ncbi:hypothetical protein H4219_006344, partial [Mycoemilia scoparia]
QLNRSFRDAVLKTIEPVFANHILPRLSSYPNQSSARPISSRHLEDAFMIKQHIDDFRSGKISGGRSGAVILETVVNLLEH